MQQWCTFNKFIVSGMQTFPLVPVAIELVRVTRMSLSNDKWESRVCEMV